MEKTLAVAETFEPALAQHWICNGLEDCVSAFDGFGREKCGVFSSKALDAAKASSISFQNIARARDRVREHFGPDYMGQAEHLLMEGQPGKFDHVPAAVLSGAVLEKALRTLCSEQQPSISLTTSRGEPKTLNPLVDDLKKAGLFNEAKAKQLRAWAAIRNHAAHGEFDQFSRKDVEQMIQSIKSFLADYVK